MVNSPYPELIFPATVRRVCQLSSVVNVSLMTISSKPGCISGVAEGIGVGILIVGVAVGGNQMIVGVDVTVMVGVLVGNGASAGSRLPLQPDDDAQIVSPKTATLAA